MKGEFQAYARLKAQEWVQNCDMFILPVDINDLKDRPKNTEELKCRAAQGIRAMEDIPGDAASGIFKDKNGVTLACVFARRSSNVTKISGVRPPYSFLILLSEHGKLTGMLSWHRRKNSIGPFRFSSR